MSKTYYNVPNIAEKLFAELCIRDFAGGGYYKAEILGNTPGSKPGDWTFNITTACEEEDQHMRYVLSLLEES